MRCSKSGNPVSASSRPAATACKIFGSESGQRRNAHSPQSSDLARPPAVAAAASFVSGLTFIGWNSKRSSEARMPSVSKSIFTSPCERATCHRVVIS